MQNVTRLNYKSFKESGFYMLSVYESFPIYFIDLFKTVAT